MASNNNNNNNNNNNSISRTRRTADGRSAGGKIVRGRRTARTPYDRPIPSTNRATQTQNPNWFTGIIYPTSRLIATSATSLLSSIFRPDTSSSSSSSSSSSASDCSEDGIDYENDDCRTPFVGIDGLKKNGTTPELIDCFTKEPQLTVGKSETKRVLEKLLMQETFSREECDRLIMIINSRVIDGSDIQEQHDGRLDIHDLCSKAVMEAKQWLEEKKVVPSCKSNLDHGTCTLNSVVLPQVAAGEMGSPVDMAKSYMLARPPWASPSINYVDSRTPLPMGRELLKEETPFSISSNSFSSSKQKICSLSSGSWNIQEEIRRVRSKAMDDMIRTTPSTKFDLSSFALEPKSIKKSLLADETELSGADKMNDLNMLPATKSIDASLELAVRENTCHGLPASVLEVTQDCSCNEDLLYQSVGFSSAQNQDLEPIQTIEGEEHAVSKSRHATISELALEPESRLSDRTCSSAREETEVRGNPNANGYPFSVSSLSTEDVAQNPRPSGVSSSRDNLANNIPREETCELLSEASIEVPVVNETNSVASGSLNSSTLHCEELTQKEIQLNPEHGSTGKATNKAEKQQGRKLSRYNRKSRGKG